VGGRSLPEVNARENVQGLYEELKTFTDVLALVERDYVRPVESQELVKGAIKGMLATLDPHSGYLDPDFYKDLQVQTKGEFGGLGIEITIKDGLLVVVSPMESSPAAKAGILPGDAIVKIEGKYTKEYSLVDAVKKLRGPKGSPIKISVQREGIDGLIDVVIIRDKITVTSVRSRYLNDGYGYIRLNQFVEKSADDIKSGLAKIRSVAPNGKIKGLVLDLRNNPGGLLTQAVRISDMFLEDGVIVYTDGRVETQKQKFFAHARGTEPSYPIVVIVNGGSASAAEIVSGALKDHGRGLILGTQTFGKGSVQTITPLDNGGALTLTTALYYTKSGRSLQAKGVEPDIIVEETKPKDIKGGKHVEYSRYREADLPGAIKNPSVSGGSDDKIKEMNKIESEETDIISINPETVDLNEWYRRDVQMSKAVELLKTFNIFTGQKIEDITKKLIEQSS
ncbi:MAG: S41 family peptidase, partial [Bdellovibrionales bacterium]|nr:S41 family peptidase [Bdellovibrionales bacterium]